MERISIILELIACMISFGICIAVLNAEFPRRKAISFWSCLLWGILFVCVTYFEIGSNIAASVLGMGICIGFAQLYFSGSFGAKLISVLRVNVFTILIGIGCIQVVSAISGIAVDVLTQNGSGSMRIAVICITKSFCILAAYFYIGSLKGRNYLKREELLISGFFSVSFFIVALFFIILLEKTVLTYTMQLAFAGIILLLFGIHVSILFLFELLHHQNQKILENSILRTQLREQERLMKATEDSNKEMMELRHDMKRYFTNYLYLLEKGETDLVKQEMRKTFDQKLSSNQMVYTSNAILNAVINEKKDVCEKNGIPLFVTVKLPQDMDGMEFAIMLSNLLDNAIEAEQQETQKGIWLDMEVVDGMMNLIVENRIKASVLKRNPHLHTTKEVKSEHGMGIGIVRQIVDQFQGFFRVREEEGKFIVHIMIPVANFARNR